MAAVVVGEVREVRSTPAAQQGAPDRLLSTSTSFRSDYWRVAADMVAREPLLGVGAGGYERTWLRERSTLLFVRDAHNLYLETLAELGPVGLALILVALGTPLLAAQRAATNLAGRAALAAFVALIAHAALDWDWELPAVALSIILLGVCLLQLGCVPRVLRLHRGGRTVLLSGAALLVAVALVAHAGNGSAAEAHEALDRGDAATARREAERARRFAPWAAEPVQLIGEAELAAGRLSAARERLRQATAEDPGAWSAWLALAFASQGGEHQLARDRARTLNPLAPELEAVAQEER